MKASSLLGKAPWILLAVAVSGQPAAAVDGCRAADVVANGVVDQDDLDSVIEAANRGSSCPRRDLDGSGKVDLADIVVVSSFIDVTCPVCPADLDDTDVVDDADRQQLEAGYGLDCRADLNRDGKIDDFDSELLQAYVELATGPMSPDEARAAARADLNGDGAVDDSDGVVLLEAADADPDCRLDFDGNAAVNRTDLWHLLASWGDCPLVALTAVGPGDLDDPCDKGHNRSP